MALASFVFCFHRFKCAQANNVKRYHVVWCEHCLGSWSSKTWVSTKEGMMLSGRLLSWNVPKNSYQDRVATRSSNSQQALSNLIPDIVQASNRSLSKPPKWSITSSILSTLWDTARSDKLDFIAESVPCITIIKVHPLVTTPRNFTGVLLQWKKSNILQTLPTESDKYNSMNRISSCGPTNTRKCEIVNNQKANNNLHEACSYKHKGLLQSMQ